MNRKIFTRDIATRTVLFLTTVCFLSGRAKAQTVNGTFHGTVSDSSGAILPGATTIRSSAPKIDHRMAMTRSTARM